MSLQEKYIPSEMYTHLLSKGADCGQDLERQIEEFLKFALLLSYAPPDQPWFVPISEEIDEIWHAYILQTREYERFCRALPGQRGFLHHHSIPYATYRASRTEADLQAEHAWWLAAYVSTFGPFTAPVVLYWMVVDYLIASHGWTVDDVNRFAFGLHREQGIGPFMY